MDALNGGEYEQPIEGVAEDEPKVDSPRTVWFRDNRELLSKKEEEEKAAKEEIMAKAREHIATFNAVLSRILPHRHRLRLRIGKRELRRLNS